MNRATLFSATEFPLLEVEEAAVRESLLDTRKRLDLVHERLAEARRLTLELEIEREQLQESVDMHKAVLSPGRRLPTEILSEIMLACIHGEKFDSLHTDNGAWILGQVSHRWRTVALNLQALWSAVVVKVDGFTTSNSLTILREWLRRSGSHSLVDIKFCYPPREITQTTQVCRDLLDILADHSSRWRSVDLQLKNRDFMSLFRVRGKLGNLRALTLNHVSTRPLKNVVHAFETAPRLKEIGLFNFCDAELFLKLPWAQITVYKARVSTPLDHRRIFALAPRLQSCCLAYEKSGIPDVRQASAKVEDSSISLHHLQKLVFWNTVPSDLHLPALEDISIWCDMKTKNAFLGPTQMISYSRCTVRRLSINAVVFHTAPITDLLRVCHSLDSLELRAYGDKLSHLTGIIRAMIVPDVECLSEESDAVLVPSLTNFSLLVEGRADLDHILLTDMLESRWRLPRPAAVSALRAFRFSDKQVRTAPGSMSRVKTFMLQGMEISIEPAWLSDVVLG